MKKPIKIGDKIYKHKKDALLYYKNILNSYKFGQSLNDDDFNDLIDLLNYSYLCWCEENVDLEELTYEYQKEILSECKDILNNSNIEESFNEHETYFNDNEEFVLNDNGEFELFGNFEGKEEEDLEIIDIKVSKVQFNNKCFEVVYSDLSSCYISYLMRINRTKLSLDELFNIACRNVIYKDMLDVKQKYFDANSVKGFVKCQETNQMSKWEDLVVDHRQPNTFSVIIDRFKELNKIDVSKVEYLKNDNNLFILKDKNLISDFIKYHKEKANLRIVRKECNLSRTGMARIKRSTKDLTIK